ncbi:glycine cleavage system aminomethyltransferase GcvT [Nocardia vinacea]|uniref:glycine cleavage system aminomethyltransferase GcvT n=1 Tax=Nocardia vinacea TaxID=96468 RepID=UPI000305E054|nr:glycine cleavage system aminomethyltransferase GcvT [Nocardia vinacea]
MTDANLLQGPIHAVHVELGAKFAPFGGWEMPVSYAGTVGEHQAVRTTVGLFDVSHLGKATVRGAGAADFVNSALTNDLGRIRPGKAQYTLCCAPDGGVIDDLIAYYVGDDEIFLVPNAANTAAVVAELQKVAPEGITVTDEHREYGVFAVQGPRSTEVLTALGLPTDMEYMAYADAEWDGRRIRVCRTGYTGEHGYELLPRWADAEPLFRALAEQVRAHGGQPAGLGARDTLRTEMGYPLHGHELSLEISPVQARCGWAIGWKKAEFWGKAALEQEKSAGPRRILLGLKALDRGVLRQGQAVLRDGAPVGETTSGTFSPSLQIGIALALLDTAAGLEPGAEVEVDVRGRRLRCEVVRPPFVDTKTK